MSWSPVRSALQPILPNRAEIFAAQNPAGYALLLLHLVSAKFRFAQMPQLRGDAGRRVMRELGEFLERQRGVALAGAEHHVQSTSRCLRVSAVARRIVCFSNLLLVCRIVASSPAAGYSSAGILSATRSALFSSVTLVAFLERPRRAVRILVIPRARAARAFTQTSALGRGLRGPAVNS